MAFILGKANEREIREIEDMGYDVKRGPFSGMEGFYGDEPYNEDEDQDIRIAVDWDVVDIAYRLNSMSGVKS